EAGFEALEADFLAGVDAVAVAAVLDALERAVDLADQLAVAVAGAQLEAVLGLAAGALGFVTDVTHLFLEVLDGLLGLLDQLFLPLQQALAEVLEVHRAHVFLFGAGLVAGRQLDAAGAHRQRLDALGARRRWLDVTGDHAALG